MESLRQSSIHRDILAPAISVVGRRKGRLNALTSSLGRMMLNSLTVFVEGTLSSGFCLCGVCSAEGGSVNVVEREGGGLRAKERSAEKGTASGGKHFMTCFWIFLLFFFL